MSAIKSPLGPLPSRRASSAAPGREEGTQGTHVGAGVCGVCEHTCVRPGIAAVPAAPSRSHGDTAWEGQMEILGKDGSFPGVLCVPREAGGGWGCADVQTLRDPEGLSLPRVPQLRRGGSGGLRTPPRGHRGRGAAVPARGAVGRGRGTGRGRAAPTVSPKGRWGQDGVTKCHNTPCPQAEPEVSPRTRGGEGTSPAPFPGRATSQGTRNGARRGRAGLGAVTSRGRDRHIHIVPKTPNASRSPWGHDPMGSCSWQGTTMVMLSATECPQSPHPHPHPHRVAFPPPWGGGTRWMSPLTVTKAPRGQLGEEPAAAPTEAFPEILRKEKTRLRKRKISSGKRSRVSNWDVQISI